MAGEGCPRRGEEGVRGGSRLPVPERQPGRHARGGGDRAHHRMPVQVLTEVQLAGAFRDGRQPVCDRFCDRAAQARVPAQLDGVHLGEAAADVEPGNSGRQRLGQQRVDLDDLAPGGAKQLLCLCVPERERPSGHQADHRTSGHRADHLGGVPGAGVECRGCPGELPDSFQVDVLRDVCCEGRDGRRRLQPFRCRYQPEVTRRRGDSGVAGDGSQHRQSGSLEHCGELRSVPRAADPVHDDPGDGDPWVEGAQADGSCSRRP